MMFGSRPGAARKSPAGAAPAWLDQIDSYDGFERQEAVQALCRLRHAPALPQLLVRVNDWVPQVRIAAAAAVRALMDEAFVAHWSSALESIVALERARRADHAALLNDVAGFLARPTCLREMRRASANASASIQRYVLELDWRAADTDEQRFGLLSSALAGSDLGRARAALARVPMLSEAAQRTALANTACGSGFGPVRAAGLRWLVAAPDPATAGLVRRLCLDRSATVRAIAWDAARRVGDAQLVTAAAQGQYARVDLPSKEKAGLLQFLCKADMRAAYPLCEAAAVSEAAALRRIAIGVLLGHSRDGEQERWLLAALADASPKVRRMAVQAVQGGAMPPPPEHLLSMVLSCPDASALTQVFGVLRSHPSWTRLHALLCALGHELPADKMNLCVAALDSWERDANNSFVGPSRAQSAAISEQWRRHQARLTADLRGRVALHLRTYKVVDQAGSGA